MKHFGRHLAIIFILFLGFGVLPANTDYIAPQQFVIDVDTTITIIISGNLNTGIGGMTGSLATPLDINFNIDTNEAVNDIRLKAIITDASAVSHSGFYCTDTSATARQSLRRSVPRHRNNK